MPLTQGNINELFYPQGETVRSGVIPYTYVTYPNGESEILWLMGTLVSGRYSDFGGSCYPSKGETPYTCMLREVDEESNGLLTEPVRQVLEKAFHEQKENGVRVWIWINERRPEVKSYLVFVYLDYYPLANISQEFTENEENISINWYNAKEILKVPITEFNTNIQKFIRYFIYD